MWPCLGWIVAALLLGYLIGTRPWKKTLKLRKRCAQIAVYRGRRADELFMLLGGAAQEVTMLPDGRKLCKWQQNGYSITLCFGPDDVCQGVYDECG